MKKILSIAAIFATTVFAMDIMPYGAYINYSSQTTKDKGYVGGVYASCFNMPYKIELDAEHTLIKYKKEFNLNDWRQSDLTFVGTYYYDKNYALKAGIHNMWTKQDNSEYDKVFIIGAKYYEYLKYNFGLDYYDSDYKGFNVYQYTPYVGYNFGDYYSVYGSYYAEIKANFIHVTNHQAPKNNYTNFDFKLQNFKGAWTTTLNFSVGKSAYKTSNGGFIVYNLGEEYKYDAGISINYAIDKTNSIKIGYDRSKFEEDSENAYSNVYTVSYSMAF